MNKIIRLFSVIFLLFPWEGETIEKITRLSKAYDDLCKF